MVENRRTRLPDEAEIAAINARHLIDTPIKPADLLFVFGTREDVARRVDEAFRLWRGDTFRWSIVSGGVTPGSGLSGCACSANGTRSSPTRRKASSRSGRSAKARSGKVEAGFPKRSRSNKVIE